VLKVVAKNIEEEVGLNTKTENTHTHMHANRELCGAFCSDLAMRIGNQRLHKEMCVVNEKL
jgi:hypothetical protein